MKQRLGDAFLLSGFGLVIAGLWWIFPPAALVVSGLVFTALGARLYGAF